MVAIIATYVEVIMFKHVLLATDGSANASRAAAAAADIAATYGARLTLVTVLSRFMMLEDIESMPVARKLPRAAKDELRRIHRMIPKSSTDIDVYSYIPALPSLIDALGEVILDEAEKAATRRKLRKITRVAVEGEAATQILKLVNDGKADLVVLGTRGLSNFRGLLIGGVSNKVIHGVKCPCLLVK